MAYRLLIVPGDNEVLRSLQGQLAEDIDALLLDTANDALWAARRAPPEAIIVNIDLPGMSGLDLAEILPGVGVSTKVVLWSRVANRELAKHAASQGVHRFLSGPLSSDELCKVLYEVLDHPQAAATRSEPATEHQQQDHDHPAWQHPSAEKMETDEQRQQLRELLRTHQSRLHVLELQQAQQGIQTPAHIITEIDAIQRQIARVTAQLMTATPARTREQQRKLRADAFKAYHRRAWAAAEDLLVQALSADPDDHEVRERLRTVQQRLNADALYQAIRELRDEDLWQETLDALDDLQREYADAKDPDGLRAWADGRRTYEELYAQARNARRRSAWQQTLGLLDDLQHQQPGAPDPEGLRAWAESRRQVAELYRDAQYACQRGDWRAVLEHLELRASLEPDAPDPEGLRAWAEHELQRVALYDAAIAALETLLATFPEEAPAREALDLLRGQI